MKWLSVTATLSGMATAGLGLMGFAICYLPIATGIAAGLTGILSILAAFSHDNAHWLSGAGLALLGAGVLLIRTSRLRCHATLR